MGSIKTFKELEAWKQSLGLSKLVYLLTRNPEFKRDLMLCSQIRRAAVSIPSNIAEGFEREGKRELIQHLTISKGSAAEVQTQLHIAFEIGYISQEEFTEADVDIVAIDGAGNKAVEEFDVTIYTLETIEQPNFFEIGTVNFVPEFIDKQAASKIPISVFISPEIKIIDEYNNPTWNPQIIYMEVDCSDTEHLTNTGLLNEYSSNPYIHVRVIP